MPTVQERIKSYLFKEDSDNKSTYSVHVPKSITLQEQIKGEVLDSKIQIPKNIGVAHPFDFQVTEDLYREYGFVTAVVDKYVDFIIGPKFFIKSEDERAKEIIEQFIEDHDFDTLLRAWTKEGLTKGNGFLEIAKDKNKAIKQLKVLNAKNMFIERDKKGNVEGYNQILNRVKKPINFKPDDIAHLPINKISGDAYGLGIIWPGAVFVDGLIHSEKDLHLIMSRKANAPYHIKMGSLEHNDLPTPGQIAEVGARLEWLTNKHEWTTGPNIEIKPIDFGNIGDKFNFVIEHDLQMMFFAFQIPAVIMGMANVPEGLAKVQADTFERRIQSFQAEIEKVIESKIFTPILQANGIETKVEFEWGQPSQTEKNERIDRISGLLSIQNLNPKMLDMLELDLAKNLGFNVKELEDAQEERDREEEREQPIVPGQNRDEQKYQKYVEEKNWSLLEWIGFNYKQYLEEIDNFIDADTFELLQGKTTIDLLSGKLNPTQVTKLKSVLKNSFAEGASIREIATRINSQVNPGPLLKIEDGKIKIGRDGKAIVSVSQKQRSIAIARSETTRTAVEGSLRHYEKGGVKEVKFISSIGPRTCPICEALNGEIYPLESATGIIPVHSMCRCTFVPITEIS